MSPRGPSLGRERAYAYGERVGDNVNKLNGSSLIYHRPGRRWTRDT